MKLVIDRQEIDVTLYDTPAANALYDMLPLDLNFEDFNAVEKSLISITNCRLRGILTVALLMWATFACMLHGAIYPYSIMIFDIQIR